MNSITIITIVVVALLTLVIFWLTWIGYTSCLKIYKIEIEQGKHDKEIFNEFHVKKKNKVGGLIGQISSYLILLILVGLFGVGVVYKARGENLSINNQIVLVIKSGSMSDFYDDETAKDLNYDRSLQFNIGDICIFETVFNDELVEGDVYGYKYKNIIITHRWHLDKDSGYLGFKGDNNRNFDAPVARENVIFHYTGKRVPGIGAIILYTQSWLGIWSITSIIGVAISSEIIYYQINKINKARDKQLGGDRYEK